LNERIIFLGTPIDDQIANLGIAALLHLESEDPGTDISLYTTATAAQTTPGLAIYDTIQFVRPNYRRGHQVVTRGTCVGVATRRPPPPLDFRGHTGDPRSQG
jgi:ATP-dependent Clp endopeptidase proteolytic subunit ClpP